MIKEDSLISDIKEHFNTLLNARSLAISNDERVLEFLLEKSRFKNEYKERFFQAQYGAIIFKKDEFLNFLDLRLLSHSYTSFSNKIGLGVSEKKFLKNSQNVVLNFPFKDCVLKGSQSKDDDKNTELFFNNILAKSEIDLLFAPKVLNKFELIGGGDLETTLKNRPNLLIKGNNLIALHSLKEYFRHQSEQNKVKLIYIDPPYNPNSAANTFSYNNNFNHSTWLTFMKNRLEIAKEFLRDDGIFCVAIDHNELFYLGVLCDEIFGRDNRIGLVSVETNPGGRSDSKFLATSNEFFIAYAKNIEKATINDLRLSDDELKQYKLKDEISNYKLVPLKRTGSNSTPDKRPNLCFPIYYDKTNKKISLEKKDGLVEILPIGSDNIMRVWRWGKEKIMKQLNDLEVKENKGVFTISVKDRIKFLKKAKTQWSNPRYDASSYGTKYLDKFKLLDTFSYPKSIGLMEDIIELFTNKGDLILDYHAGSGTTLEAAHKMKRRYIGIEQMEYIESITKERLKKVIEGEQGGISKAVSWSGGGNLIYCELASLNAKFIEKIENSSDENELNQIYENLQKIAFIDYRVDIKNDLKDDEFLNLDFTSKKRILKKCLDRNMDYIPYADIDDSEYKIDERAKKLNKIFYGENDG